MQVAIQGGVNTAAVRISVRISLERSFHSASARLELILIESIYKYRKYIYTYVYKIDRNNSSASVGNYK